MHKVGWFLSGLFFTTILTFGIIAVSFSMGFFQNAFAEEQMFAGSFYGEAMKDSPNNFAFDGTYNFRGEQNIPFYGKLKVDIGYPATHQYCNKSMLQNILIYKIQENKKHDIFMMKANGVVCENPNNDWKTFRGYYKVIDGKVVTEKIYNTIILKKVGTKQFYEIGTATDRANIDGVGLIEITYNTKTGDMQGTWQGNIELIYGIK